MAAEHEANNNCHSSVRLNGSSVLRIKVKVENKKMVIDTHSYATLALSTLFRDEKVTMC